MGGSFLKAPSPIATVFYADALPTGLMFTVLPVRMVRGRTR